MALNAQEFFYFRDRQQGNDNPKAAKQLSAKNKF
jgi:hypothetical protein